MRSIGIRIGLVSAVQERVILSGGRVVSGSISSTMTVLGELVLVVLKFELINITTNHNGNIKENDKPDDHDDCGDGFLPSLEVDDARLCDLIVRISEVTSFEEVISAEDGVEEETGCCEGHEEDNPCKRGVSFHEFAFAGDGTDETE